VGRASLATVRNFSYFRILVVGFFSQIVPSIAQTQDHALKFDKEIGVGWRTGEYRGWMSFVAFSADGTMVASDGPAAADDVSGDLTLWSFPDGRLIKRLPAQPTAISHDWKYYATYHSVAELETGRPVISLGKDVYAIYAFSPDSRYVAESIDGHGLRKIHVVELTTGKQVNAFGRSAPSSMAISPDGFTLAAGYWDVIILWDMLTGKTLGAMSGAGHYVAGLSFSQDGKLIAAGTGVGGLQIWDVTLRSKVASIDIGFGAGVSEPAFSPDGRLVAFGVYGTGTAWLVDVSRGKVIDHQKVSDLGCGSVAFSPDGRFLITPSTGGLIKWPYDKGGTIRVFTVTP
jgi:WD40 repeat protein